MDTRIKLRIFTPEWIYAGYSKWHFKLQKMHLPLVISHLSFVIAIQIECLLSVVKRLRSVAKTETFNPDNNDK
jgi:hypothetical protein